MNTLEKALEALKTTAGNIRSLGPCGAIPEPCRPWLVVVEDAIVALEEQPNRRAEMITADPILAAQEDRAMLEKAAKNSGIELPTESPWDGYHPEKGFFKLCFDGSKRVWNWNPLANDGDALRLAVRSGLLGDPRQDIAVVRRKIVCFAASARSI